MKKLLLAGAAALSMTVATAHADNVKVNDAFVTNHYNTVVKRIPQTEQICRTVDVPIYGHNNKNNTNDMIIGGIIGGILGNQIGKGSGKEAATGIGALSGAIIANENAKKHNQPIIGYRQVEQCENKTTYTTTEHEVYSHSTITFWEDGRKYVVQFRK